MKESTFNSELKNSLEEQGAFAYKIPDSPASWTMHVTRFTPEKPCDIVGMYHAIGFIIESKQIKKWEAFGKTQLRPGQIKALTEAVQKKNPAYVFLNVRLKAVKGEQEHLNRVIIFDWHVWGDKLRHETIKAKDLRDLPFIEGRTINKKMRYDLTGFLGELYGLKRRS